jgi:dihydroceramidase
MQLVDELSMIYTTCLMCFATFAFNKSRRFSIVLGVSLMCLAIFITLYYHYLQDPAFHQNAYALLTVTVVFWNIYIMEKALRPSWRRAQRERDDAQLGRELSTEERMQRQSIDHRNNHILKTQWLMVIYGISVFLGGFAIWSLDNKYCSTIRKWRRQMGLPWGILLEGHGWW